MSNIGKQRILVPNNVKIKCNGWKIHAQGKHGQVSINFPIHTQLIIESNYLRILAPYLDSALYGSLQTKVKALIHGLSLPYVRSLQFVGVGYRPRIENDLLIIRLGYSHEVKLPIPKDLNVSVVKKNNLRIAGSDFESVCQYAYRVRSFRPPEPFKGKGIVCLGEKVRRKEGKKKKL
jgi:large subunit ribosomal protein L6